MRFRPHSSSGRYGECPPADSRREHGRDSSTGGTRRVDGDDTWHVGTARRSPGHPRDDRHRGVADACSSHRPRSRSGTARTRTRGRRRAEGTDGRPTRTRPREALAVRVSSGPRSDCLTPSASRAKANTWLPRGRSFDGGATPLLTAAELRALKGARHATVHASQSGRSGGRDSAAGANLISHKRRSPGRSLPRRSERGRLHQPGTGAQRCSRRETADGRHGLVIAKQKK